MSVVNVELVGGPMDGETFISLGAPMEMVFPLCDGPYFGDGIDPSEATATGEIRYVRRVGGTETEGPLRYDYAETYEPD